MKASLLFILAVAATAQDPPKDGQGWFLRGAQQHSAGAYDEAIAAFQEAIRLGYGVPGSMARIGRAHARKGDVTAALDWLEKAAVAGFGVSAGVETHADWAEVRKDSRLAPILARIKRNATPCLHNPKNREFDFWIGEWVVTAGGNPAGTNSIQRILDGCVLLENWTPAGGGPTGKSMNFVNPLTGKWQQTWVDSTGRVVEYSGAFQDGAMRLVGDALAGGKTVLNRMTFTSEPGGKVRQFGEQSSDGGKTWTVQFDLIYSRP